MTGPWFAFYHRLALASFVAGRDWHRDNAWICSELQAEATNVAKLFPCRFWVPSNTVTPNALAFAWSAFAPAVQVLSMVVEPAPQMAEA